MFAKTVRLLVIPAAVAAIAGCGGSAQHAQSTAAATGSVVAGAAQGGNAAPNSKVAPAGSNARGGSAAPAAYTSAQLRGGLLAHVNGASPAVPAEVGPYASLAAVKATKNSMRGVVVSPAKCGQTTLTGFNEASLANAPAAIESFHVKKNDVSEVLVVASGGAASGALGRQVPAGCFRYQTAAKGKKFMYDIKQSWVSGIGDQARVLNVKAERYPQADVWSIVYRGHGIVGAVTVIGPDASEAAVRQLGQQAYTYAVSRLR